MYKMTYNYNDMQYYCVSIEEDCNITKKISSPAMHHYDNYSVSLSGMTVTNS